MENSNLALVLNNQDIEEQVILKNVSANMLKDLSSFSSKSTFEDDIWEIDKYFAKLNVRSVLRRYDFNINVSPETKDLFKLYIYRRLLNGLSLEELNGSYRIVKKFLKDFNIFDLKDINNEVIEKFYRNLNDNEITQKRKFYVWQSIKRFLSSMDHKMSQEMELYKMEYDPGSKNDEKYASEELLKKFDKIMKEENNIPVDFRLLYWLLRLYPGRVTEAVSYNIECLKHYQGTIYCICSRVYKTAGSEEGTPKLLLIDTKEPIQKFLYDLIIKQQEIAREIHNKKPELGDFLFLKYQSRYCKEDDSYRKINQITVLEADHFNTFLRNLIDRKNIMDGDKKAKLASHMFRHNAITDRLETKLFRPIDLRPMTLHGNEQMVNKAYHHKNTEEIIKQSQDIEEKITGETVLFKGKIVNSLDDRAFEPFLRNKFAFSLNHMGICADSRACDKDKLQCLNCKYFIANCDDLGYFKEQLEEWHKKLIIAEKIKNDNYAENIKYNISLFENVIKKIEKQLAKGEIDEKN